MTSEALYEELTQRLINHRLLVDMFTGGGCYRTLLEQGRISGLKIRECSITRNGDTVIVSGECEWEGIGIPGGGSLILSAREGEKETLKVGMTLSFCRSANLRQAFGRLPSSRKNQGSRRESWFSDCVLSYAVIGWREEERWEKLPFTLSGFLEIPDSSPWEALIFLQGGQKNLQGRFAFLNRVFEGADICFDFTAILPGSVKLPFGQASLALYMDGGKARFTSEGRRYESRAYLKLSIFMDSIGKEADFYLDLFGGSTMMNLSTGFPGGISIGNIVSFLADVFGIRGDLLLPSDTLLSSFSLYEIDMTMRGKSPMGLLGEGLAAERLYLVFRLSQPLSMPVPGLTLENFRTAWEISWRGRKQPILSLYAAMEMRLRFGAYELVSKMQGELPGMQFFGGIELMMQEAQRPTLEDMLNMYHASAPAAWEAGKKTLLSGEISVSVPDRTVFLELLVNDLLTFTVGSLRIRLNQLKAGIEIAPAGNMFAISGMIELGTGKEAFAIALGAKYDGGWEFEGGLAEGEADLVKLLESIFSVTGASGFTLRILIRELQVFYSTKTGSFMITAAFSMDRFELFGKEMEIGGRVQIKKEPEQKEEPDASLLFYVQVELFRFLIQIDDFYNEKQLYLFRLEWAPVYLQAVYEKTEEEETVTVSMGGTTLGAILENLLALLNPNARCSLPAPWNILNKISLNRFLLRIYITSRIADFLYRVDQKIPGLMEIQEVGLRYSGDEGTINFILTGDLLGENYTQTSPLTWDAVDGGPPVNSTDGEKKLEVSYVGFGQHLDIKEAAKADTVAQAMEVLKEKMNGDMGTISYSGEIAWLFGLDFKIHDMFRFQMVLADPKLYGAVIEVAASEKSPLAVFNGLTFELLYKKLSEDTGMFRISFMMPEIYRNVSLGVVELEIGQIIVELYTNGSFYIDLGFPHDGDFSKSFALSFSYYTGKGGIYFGVLNGAAVRSVPAAVNGSFSPVVLLGLGLTVGLGKSFDLGIVKGGLSIEIFGLLEGVFGVFHDARSGEEAAYYKVSAVVGISGSLFLSVDLKIITIQACASITASCSLSLEAYRASEVSLDVSMKLAAYIKILFIKIRFSFTFHQHVTFTFGENETAPWRLKESGDSDASARKCRKLSAKKAPEAVCLGRWEITVRVLTLFSVENPSLSMEEPVYCMALLPSLDAKEFEKVADMLCSWIFSLWEGEQFTQEQVMNLDTERISYEEILRFLELNGRFRFEIGTESEGGEEKEGVIFPMPSQAGFSYRQEEDRGTVDFGGNPVTSSYFQEISRYFESLNADPSHDVSAGNDAEESLPFCGAVFTDWFHMALSELTRSLSGFFTEYQVESDDLDGLAERYGVDVETLLIDNRELSIGLPRIPARSYKLDREDSLQGLAERFGLSEESLTAAVGQQAGLLQNGAPISLEGITFDNRTARLTVKTAAALFYVRFWESFVSEEYHRYGKEIIELNEGLTADWSCERPYERNLSFPDGTSRQALAGDTVFRLAKEYGLLLRGGDERWDTFFGTFVEENEPEEARPDWLLLNADTAVDGDATFLDLAGRLYPDGRKLTGDNPLFTQRIWKSLAEITLKDVRSDYHGTVGGALQSGICGIGEMAAAVRVGCVRMEKQHVVVRGAKVLCKTEIMQMLRSRSAETGAWLSRFFLQGLRVPPPDKKDGDDATKPLYQMLGQQQTLKDTEQDLYLQMYKNTEGSSWLEIDTQEKVIGKEMLKKYLPAGSIRPPEAFTSIPDFVCCPDCFELSDGFPYQERNLTQVTEKSIFFLPKGLCRHMQNTASEPDVTGCDRFKWGCLTPVTLARGERENEYRFYGADAVERQKLRKLLETVPSGIRLVYRPSALDSREDCFIGEDFSENSTLVKTNLSVETHMGPVLRSGREYHYSANLSEIRSFLNMVWECSTVGGGGYTLRLIGDASLPETIFEEDGRAEIYLMVLYDSFEQTKGYPGCIITEQIEEKLLAETEDGLRYVPSLPIGCKGLKTSLQDCGEHEESARAQMKQLFHIGGYRIVGGEIPASGDCVPVLPQRGAGDRLDYQMSIPLYRLLGNNPYGAVHKTALIRPELRDVLGNRLELEECSVEGVYNDAVIGIAQLPDTGVEYRITGKAGEGAVTVRVRQQGRHGDGISRMTQAVFQYACPDMNAYMTCSISGEEKIMLSETDYGKIKDYPSEWLRYAKGESDIPAEFTVEIPVMQKPDYKTIFELEVCLVLYREGFQSENQEAVSAVCVLPPAVQAGTDIGGDAFVMDFEQVFPSLQLAQSSARDSLYVLPVGENGFLHRMEIMPYGEPDDPYCEYYALRPFARAWISREVTVAGQPHTFAQIDLNLWMKRFIQDFEEVLIRFGSRAAQLCRDGLEDLIGIKAGLAGLLASGFCSLKDGSGLGEARELLEDRLKRNLSVCFSVNTIAVYKARMEAAEYCRATVAVQGDTQDQIVPSKLSTKNGWFCLFLTEPGTSRSHSVRYSAAAEEVEYHIETLNDGYEASDWLKLIHPVRIADFCLDTDIDVPNPLLVCPGAPLLSERECRIVEEPTELLRWNYRVKCSCRAQEQYVLYARVELHKADMLKSRMQKDLFEALAEYDVYRETVWQGLAGDRDQGFTDSFKQYMEICEVVLERIREEQNNPKTVSGSSDREVQLKLSFRFTDQEHVIFQTEPVGESGKILEELGAGIGETVLVDLTPDGEMIFEWGIDRLPLYRCGSARAHMRIIQNENLLYNHKTEQFHPVSEAFIFRSQEVSNQWLYAFAEHKRIYEITETNGLEGTDVADRMNGLEGVFEAIWKMLDLSYHGIGADISVSYAWRVGGIWTEVPVTVFFGINEAESKEMAIARAAANIRSWAAENGPLKESFQWRFDVTVGQKNNKKPLLQVRLGIAEMLSMSHWK